MTSPARAAADVAALVPLDDPLGQLARRRLAGAVRELELATTTDPRAGVAQAPTRAKNRSTTHA